MARMESELSDQPASISGSAINSQTWQTASQVIGFPARLSSRKSLRGETKMEFRIWPKNKWLSIIRLLLIGMLLILITGYLIKWRTGQSRDYCQGCCQGLALEARLFDACWRLRGACAGSLAR